MALTEHIQVCLSTEEMDVLKTLSKYENASRSKLLRQAWLRDVSTDESQARLRAAKESLEQQNKDALINGLSELDEETRFQIAMLLTK